MAKQKSRQSRMSKGGRQKANVAHERKRQEKFAAKRETGEAYKYQPNPYKKGTEEYREEEYQRSLKRKSSKLPYARLTSIFAKLDNALAEEAIKEKEKNAKKSKR